MRTAGDFAAAQLPGQHGQWPRSTDSNMRIGLQTWGSEGDVQPFLALAAGLVRAGHKVTLVVADNEGRDYSGYARRFGFELVALASNLSEKQSTEAFSRVI